MLAVAGAGEEEEEGSLPPDDTVFFRLAAAEEEEEDEEEDKLKIMEQVEVEVEVGMGESGGGGGGEGCEVGIEDLLTEAEEEALFIEEFDRTLKKMLDEKAARSGWDLDQKVFFFFL